MNSPRLTVLARAIHPLHPPGGMERAVYEQLRHLHALGVPLTVVTQPPGSRAATPPAELAGIDWHFVRYGHLPLRPNSVLDRLVNYPLFVARVARHLRAQPASTHHLIHAHGLLASAAPKGVPLVYAPHGLEEFNRASLRKHLAYLPMRLALRRAAQRASVVLATDSSMVPAVRRALRVAPDRVRVIPNGVSIAWLGSLADADRRAQVITRLGLAAASLRLVTCARLEHNKGLPVALAALAAARADLPPDWCWCIIGAGREEPALRAQIARLGLAAHVHLLGRLPDSDLHNLLPAMHLYLMPSLYEGSSIATLEAMAHRLPVLATTVGGIPDKVIPGQTGYTVPPGDAQALAQALRGALAERSRWPVLGEAGRSLVLRHFDWPAIVRQLVSLYDELVPAASARISP